MITSAAGRRAYADESFHEAATGGFYVLAAVVFEWETHELVRQAMLDLRGRRDIGKLRWREMSSQQQEHAAKTVASFQGFHVVTVGSPVPAKRQERARVACLTQSVFELYSYGITELHMESRTTVLNKRDVATVRGARFHLPKGAAFRVEHVPGRHEPLLWAADMVAGAVRAHREGTEDCRRLLNGCVYEVNVVADC